MAIDLIPALGPRLVEAVGVRRGERVLDVAAGTGNAAVPAALTGADVVASDLAPELFEPGRAFGARHGVTLAWEEGDVENLPYDDGAFDVVLARVGVMFAPGTSGPPTSSCASAAPVDASACSAGRRPGSSARCSGRRGPTHPPPPGAQPPPLWGDEDHVCALLGDRVTDVVTRRESSPSTRWAARPRPRTSPTAVADDPERVAELDRALTALAARFDRGADTTLLEWEYLIVTARVAG